jgi:hypothetical protein
MIYFDFWLAFSAGRYLVNVDLRLGLTFDQGDQIGRIFAYWAVVYFGQFW